jgi:hypothetical protein
MAIAASAGSAVPAGSAGSGGEPTTQMLPRVSFAEPVPATAGLSRIPVAITGSVVVLAGVITQIVAIVAAPWWQATIDKQPVRMNFADFAPRAWRGFAFMYFTWGAWLIVGLTLGLGVVSCVRWRGAHVFRVIGALFGVVAAFAPIAALLVFSYQAQSDVFHVVRSYAIGPYLAVLGTMATAFGAAAGSAR